jgi:hypothetical protein
MTNAQRLAAFFVVLVAALIARADQTLVSGVIELPAKDGRLVSYRYQARTNDAGISSVQITEGNSAGGSVVFRRESSVPGELLLDSVRPYHLKGKSGEALGLFWTRGTAEGFWLIGVGKGGNIGVLFEDYCRQGHYVLRLSPQDELNIVAFDGMVYDKASTAHIYRIAADGTVSLLREEARDVPGLFAIINKSEARF